tara:strand:- start:57 stop:440 length:384 start_codon:yes stop_codon:yes gene_type:complete
VTGEDVLKAMEGGSTLHSSMFGFWLMSPIDSRCINVHHGAAKSLVRKRVIRRISGGDSDGTWTKVSGGELREGDLLTVYKGYRIRNHGYYPPDKCNWWEAINISTGEADFRAHTKPDILFQIDSHEQ